MRSKDARVAALAAALMLTTAHVAAAQAAPAARAATSTVTLQWTAPGDDGHVGEAMRYELRYSTEPITEANWSGAAVANDVPHPQGAGRREKVKVRGLAGGTEYFFAVRAVDEAGNWSALSNVAYKTAPDPALVPAQYTTALSAPWPCPTRGPVRFEMTLARDANVSVQVFDAGGRRVKWLTEGAYSAGTTLLGWDGRDEQHRTLPIGNYFIVGRLGGETFRRVVTLLP